MREAGDFAVAIAAALGAGPDPGEILPGRMLRFSTNGKRGDDSGWCKLFEDCRGGVFGNWRTGEQHTWRAAGQARLDRSKLRAEIAAAQAARAQEIAERQAAATEAARIIWSRAEPCSAHPYLDRKAVHPDGLRVQFGNAREVRGHFFTTSDAGDKEPLRGLLLLIPMRDMQQGVQSLQAIDERGRKSFLKGARKTGLFHVVAASEIRGAAPDHRGPIAIAEGYATAASVRQLQGWPCFVAFDAGNLLPVAEAVRDRFPMASITVCGDNDRSGTGQEKAEEAAAAIGAAVAIPPFTEEEQARGMTDWNDYANLLRTRERGSACSKT